MLWVFIAALTVCSGQAENDDFVTLEKDGAVASIHKHGATITSWKVGGQERLFLSAASKLDGSSHIMGGVPIVFPKFADWGPDRPFHGFARVSRWDLLKAEDGNAVFELKDSEVIPGDIGTLVSDLNTQSACNPNSFAQLCEFSTHLLSNSLLKYFITPSCELKMYKDKTRNFDEFTETRELLPIGGFTDSVYQDTPTAHNVSNTIDGQTIELKKSGLPDLVVWNPWSEVIKTFSDLKPDEWVNFVCTEAGHVASKIELEPGHVYEASQTLNILNAEF